MLFFAKTGEEAAQLATIPTVVRVPLVPEVMNSHPLVIGRFDRWSLFTDFAEPYRSAGPSPPIRYVFRGQSDASWDLMPSIGRIAAQHELGAERAVELEKEELEEFRREAPLFVRVGLIPSNDDVIGWWTLMQHYGAPTRLLDWTVSPYIAAYFAAQDFRTDGALFFYDSWEVVKHMKTVPGCEEGLPQEPNRLRDTLWNPAAAAAVFSVLAPTRSERMAAQQGIFTVSPNILCDHWEVIGPVGEPHRRRESAKREKEGPITLEPQEVGGESYKIILPKGQKPTFLHWLNVMGITAESLFPGIEGLGRSVAERLRLRSYLESQIRDHVDLARIGGRHPFST